MTDQALYDAIQADPAAKALADAGADAACAARLATTLPPVVKPAFLTKRGLYDALVDPLAAIAVMNVLKAVAAGNPSATPPVPPNLAVADVLTWLDPSEGGVDVGSPAVRAMLDQLQGAGLLPAASVATIKGLAQSPAEVHHGDVSRVMLPHRPGGIVGGTA